MFLIIAEFRHERNYFQISSNTEREAYIGFLSSCLPEFIYILETIFFCTHFTWIYLSSYLQSFRGTSRHAPVAFFSFLMHFAVDSVFSSRRLGSRGISGYEQFPAKILLHKPWGLQRTSKTILLAGNVVLFFDGKVYFECTQLVRQWCLKQSDWFAFNSTSKLIIRS